MSVAALKRQQSASLMLYSQTPPARLDYTLLAPNLYRIKFNSQQQALDFLSQDNQFTHKYSHQEYQKAIKRTINNIPIGVTLVAIKQLIQTRYGPVAHVAHYQNSSRRNYRCVVRFNTPQQSQLFRPQEIQEFLKQQHGLSDQKQDILRKNIIVDEDQEIDINNKISNGMGRRIKRIKKRVEGDKAFRSVLKMKQRVEQKKRSELFNGVDLLQQRRQRRRDRIQENAKKGKRELRKRDEKV